MTDEWFHKRGAREGTGYSVKSRNGLIAAVIFIILVVAVVIGAVQASVVFRTPALPTLLVGMGIVVVMIIAFVAMVMSRSDARK